MNIENREPNASDNIEADSETTEAVEPKENFEAEDAEVTIKRTNGELEGGWEVFGPDKKKEGRVIIKSPGRKLEKSVSVEELLKLQPFQDGESVPVIRSGGKVDSEGWTILKSLGCGIFRVVKIIEGKPVTKILRKSALINAKIVELKLEKEKITAWNDSISEDYKAIKRIDDDMKYWQAKLKTVSYLAEESLKHSDKGAGVKLEATSDGNIDGETPII